MIKLKCACGNKTESIRYVNSKKVCNKCEPKSLSGQWERRIMGERMQHAKDILQKYNKDGSINKDFQEAYGEGRNV